MIVLTLTNVCEEVVCLLAALTNVVLMRSVFHKVIVRFASVPKNIKAIQELNVTSFHAFLIQNDQNVNETLIVDWIKNAMMRDVLTHVALVMLVVAVPTASHKITKPSVNVCQDTVAIRKSHVIHQLTLTLNVVQIHNAHHRNLVSTCIASIHVIVGLMPIVSLKIIILSVHANPDTRAMR